MSDILSNFYQTLYTFNNNREYKNPLTPNKQRKIKNSLSKYGIYLSKNNYLLLSKENMQPLSSSSLNKDSNIISNLSNLGEPENIIFKSEEQKLKSKDILSKDLFNTIDPQLKKCFSYRKKKNFLLDNIYDFDDYNNKIKNKIIDKNKSRNKGLPELKNEINIKYKNKGISELMIKSPRYEKKGIYFKTVKKESEENNNEKEKMINQKKADKITNELLSLKTRKDIKDYYIKKEYNEGLITNIKRNEKIKEKRIDPMTYIKYNFSNEPNNISIFKSFDIQMMIMGNDRYRNNLLDGVNVYKNNFIKYENLKGPIGFDKNKIEEKKRDKIINQMKIDNLDKDKAFNFSNRLYKRKYNKKIFDFVYDDNYKNLKKLLNKNIEKYDKQTKIVKGKKIVVTVDKKDIKTLKKVDSDAEFVINDKDEMIKFSNKFLSFDNKINKMLSKTNNTTNFLFKRAQEHHKIKRKIDQLYKKIDDYFYFG
jgi:hypothetical protein